jgi:phosphate transport system permease protein
MAVATTALPRVLTRSRTDRRRAIVDRAFRGLAFVAALAIVVINGIAAVNVDLLTKPPKALGVGGGAAAAILGSLQLVALATVLAVPIGVLAAVYTSEFAGRRTAAIVRFAADVMVGIPSILIGIFVFTFLVLPFRHFNAFAGGVALAILMVPVVMRTTEEIIRLVPASLREASLALGVPAWRTVLSVVLRTGLGGILTGIMLAVARAAGETAPLLFTALGSQYLSFRLNQPMAALPLTVFTYATGPYEEWHQFAWAAALVLILVVFVTAWALVIILA